MANVFDTLPYGLDEVDVIIAGGGTAGCVVASRLSDADPNLSVLVIEGGQNNHSDPSIVNPVLMISHMLPTSKTTLFYKGNKETSLSDREIVIPSGGVLGGGSSINLMTYSRPQRGDLDSWNTPGWSTDELLPYMKKFETYHGRGTEETHGKDGPIEISNGTFVATRSQNDFMQAAAQIGFPEAKDLQNFEANNAFQRNMQFIDRDGKRQDAAHRYLHPRLEDGKHANLNVLVETQVVRVLFENKKAAGVEFQPNSKFKSASAVRSIKARKLVVVSCGSLGTPLVLERSGLGNPDILARAGVDLVADVPGVGENYMDHHLMTYAYKSSLQPDETVDAIYGGRVDVAQLMQNKDKILGWNATDVTSKVRPSEAEVTALGTDFRTAWDRDFKDKPSKPISIITSLNGYPGDPTGVPVGQYVAISTFSAYPYSRGHLHITGTKLEDSLNLTTGFCSDAENFDVKVSMWSYKKQREILRRMNIFRGEYAPTHPPFAPGSKAACIETDVPLTDVQDIAYSPEDDVVIEKWIRQNVGSTWHSMGTCKMAPREELGVVDASLGVHGVQGLKIADLSIAPQNVAANTGSTAFLIGEKAADIFIKELGLAK